MRLRVYAPALIGLAAACTSSQPAPLPWAVEFAPGAPRPPEVVTVHAWITADGCAGERVYSVVVSASDPIAQEPPALLNGTWGFGADALDAQCRTVASGCVEVVVPSTPSVTLTLDTVDPPGGGCGARSTCVAGACVAPDGGAFDAGRLDAGGPDGGTVDGGPVDSGQRDGGAEDGGVPCTGCLEGSTCLPGTSDSACGRFGVACVACTGGVCASNSQCCTGCIYAGTCRIGTSSARCGTGGAPCTDCNETSESCVSGVCI